MSRLVGPALVHHYPLPAAVRLVSEHLGERENDSFRWFLEEICGEEQQDKRRHRFDSRLISRYE